MYGLSSFFSDFSFISEEQNAVAQGVAAARLSVQDDI